MEIWVPILVAVITGAFGVLGSVVATKKQSSVFEAVVAEKIANLKAEVEKHNKVIERTFNLETTTLRQEDELKRLNKRLENLEAK
ncbi:MAG: hypothetical protein IJR95_04590 [Lachnospiraceae bacterium]|nr:hypothetical protein [Lachnospiraceae bacterium]